MPKASRLAKAQAARARDAEQGLVTRTLRVRVKDRHAAHLRELAAQVNQVWNYDNDLCQQILRREGRFASAEDLHRFTRGASKEGLALHSQTVQAVNEEFVARRRQFKKVKLRWRVSNPTRASYSLGWVPFKALAVSWRNGQVWYAGHPFRVWDSYGLANYELGTGSFSEDARGRWYFNVTVKVKVAPAPQARGAVGVDLGLKSLATLSDGTQVDAKRFYRDLEPALAVAQRARKKDRVRAIHAKIANRRKDFLHKLSTDIARRHDAVFVGNASSSSLAQTRAAKAVLDAGWATLKTMLKYKCDDAAALFREVDEAYSTQDCSVCGARTGPKGREELWVRAWCCCCGTQHDRDVNAARNILVRGLLELAEKHAAAGTLAVNKRALSSARPGMAVQ